MHARSALPVFGRLREAVEEGAPMSAGYAAGFLCHLALDSACHGWIDRRAAEGTVTHLAMEAEFDRLLMERDGLVSLGHSYLPPMPSGEVFAAAAGPTSTPLPGSWKRAIALCGGTPPSSPVSPATV